MVPASFSPWPCCKQGVTSCLSLHLFFALPEGPPGTSRGRDGSTADPRSYGPAGSQPGSIPACAASAVKHRHSRRCSCRVPGLFLCPRHPLPPALHPQGCRHCHIGQEAGCVSSGSVLDPELYTAGRASKVSHMPTHLRSSIHTSVSQPTDI